MPDLLYHLNARDEICSVNEEWISFARANEGEPLGLRQILGRPLWDFIGDVDTQHIYRLVHRRVRTKGAAVRLSFRCDAPGRRRLLELEVSGGAEHGLTYRVRTLREQDRDPVPLLEPQRPRSEAFHDLQLVQAGRRTGWSMVGGRAGRRGAALLRRTAASAADPWSLRGVRAHPPRHAQRNRRRGDHGRPVGRRRGLTSDSGSFGEGGATVYLAMKTLHVLAVVLFLGNIITGLFWKAHGDRTADPRIIRHTLEGIIRSDRWFTLPGVVLIVGFGVAAAVSGRVPILGTGWIWQSIALFTVSGLAFMLQVAPLQRRLHQLASVGAGAGPWDQATYRRLSRRWEFWGAVAVLTPLAAVVLMVFKPGS